jgi:hypothetical protein
MARWHRDKVFVPGGQPTVTYISRDHLQLERDVRRAISQPHSFASITGTSKSGKTVLCRNVLGDRQFVWVEGGQITPLDNLWRKVGHALEQPSAVSVSEGTGTSIELSGGAEGKVKVPFVAEGSLVTKLKGSHVADKIVLTEKTVDVQNACLAHMIQKGIILVIDDFHYIDRQIQTDLLRNLKGPVFNGLKVVLLSVSYRAYEALQAEAEITGRFVHVDVPDWGVEDLAEIAKHGFAALNVKCPKKIVSTLADEANGSPQLMQNFCWSICFERDIESQAPKAASIPSSLNLDALFKLIAKDTGQPLYNKLSAGPQNRSDRMQRPLKNGGSVDVYEAVLLAIANTGPKSRLRFGEVRTSLTEVLKDNVPQNIEVSNALNQLAKISRGIANESRPIDWLEDEHTLVLADPMFRFFLRWQVAK